MTNVNYGFSRVLKGTTYEKAVQRVTEALKSEGFGVLTEIDVRKTLHDKLRADFRKYKILGACNPQLANQALEHELLIGLLLPCNVVVHEDDEGNAVVSVVDPQKMLSVAENDDLRPIAAQVEERLRRVLTSL